MLLIFYSHFSRRVLLKVSSCYRGVFPCHYDLLGGHALGFCKAPRDNFACKKCYLDKDELELE